MVSFGIGLDDGEHFGSWPEDVETTSNGDRARRAPGGFAGVPAELGYPNLYIMPAGIVGWTKAGKPVVTGDKPSS